MQILFPPRATSRSATLIHRTLPAALTGAKAAPYPPTSNQQPATFNLQPPTFNLQPLTPVTGAAAGVDAGASIKPELVEAVQGVGSERYRVIEVVKVSGWSGGGDGVGVAMRTEDPCPRKT